MQKKLTKKIEVRKKEIEKNQKRIQEFIKNYLNYVATYPDQVGYYCFSDATVIHDLLYGVGLYLYGDKFKWAGGYAKFKEALIEFLSKPESDCSVFTKK